jgi:DNA polymerase III delta subunit
MAAENALAFLRGIAQGRLPGRAILITGPQAFLREYVLEAMRQRLGRDGFEYRAFQVGGADAFGRIVSELEGADLFAPKRLIACRVLRSYRERGGGIASDPGENSEGGAGGADISADASLVAAIERLDAAAHLALLYERDNAPAKIRRLFEKAGVVVTCMRPFDNQVGQYAELFARNLGLNLSTSAMDLLAGRYGSDLTALANAIAKSAIFPGDKGKVGIANFDESGTSRIPDLFELAESLPRGNTGETVAMFDRAIQTGRDPIELLAVEVIPMLRRMLTAASILARRKGTSEIASALGLAPSSLLLTRAVEGARRFGLARLERAHWRACELDAHFKMGLLKEREQAVAAMLIELMAEGSGTATN